MALGTINSLGAGSGVLTSDKIEKLKENSEAQIIKPYENKIKANTTRTSDIKTLKTLAQDLKTMTGKLSGETLYLDRETSTSGTSAKVSAEAGAAKQSFTLNVKQLAQKQITQSQNFAQDTVKFGDGTLTFKIENKEYSVDVTDGMTLKDLKDKIFDKTDGKITASALKVGGDKPNSLVLRSTNTGEDNSFTVGGTLADKFGFKEIQKAQDAKFEYDGVDITRSSNEVKDLISGVNITLSGKGTTSVDVKEKTSGVVDQVKNFVTKYNELVTNLATVTSYDSDKKVAGSFQGSSELNSIMRSVKNSVANITSGVLEDFGLDVQKNGTLKFDQSKLESKIKTDYDGVKKFFQGTDDSEGLFKNVNTALEKTLDKNTGLFKLVGDELESKGKRLAENKERAQANLDKKYELMEKQFAAYDKMIQSMNNGFSTLKMMIQQSTSSS